MAEFKSYVHPPGYPIRVGRRLMVTRLNLDPSYEPGEMAQFMGVPYQTYMNWEKGIAEFKRNMAKVLKDNFGVTFDWIFDGDPSGLPPALRTKILALRADNPDLFNERLEPI